MKLKITPYLLFCCIISILSSCSGSDKEISVEFDRSLLVGEWRAVRNNPKGDLFYIYESDGYGITWDEADDVKISEAQAYDWRLEKAVLSYGHKMNVTTAELPKQSIVTELTSTRLKYKSYAAYGGKDFSFEKVENSAPRFDRKLLIGKWKAAPENPNGELFYMYQNDGTAKQWSTSEDVNESEAQEFTWRLGRVLLSHSFKQEAQKPDQVNRFIVTELTTTSFKYKVLGSNKDQNYTFVKLID